MSRALFLVATLPEPGAYRLDGAEGHHAADVQRVRPGEAVLLADGDGGVADCVVETAGRGRLDLHVTAVRHEPVPAPRLVVVQGLAKGDRGELAVQAMTEVGVDEIVPWQASRSIVRWRGERGERSRQRWVSVAREAAKQARRARLPVVAPLADTATVAARLAAASGGYVLHEEASQPLARVTPPDAGDLVLVVGPEGGIAPDELAALAASGATPVRLGASVLRTSTAGVAALCVLDTLLGRWT